jgi:hypothetical protein
VILPAKLMEAIICVRTVRIGLTVGFQGIGADDADGRVLPGSLAAA